MSETMIDKIPHHNVHMVPFFFVSGSHFRLEAVNQTKASALYDPVPYISVLQLVVVLQDQWFALYFQLHVQLLLTQILCYRYIQ